MSRFIYATAVRCDICGVQAEVPHPETGTFPPDPPGWICLPSVGLQRMDGVFVRDFCPACSAEPFEQVIKQALGVKVPPT